MGGALNNPSSIELQDEGVAIKAGVTYLDFVGAGVVASGNVVAISGGGGGLATHAFLTEYHSHPAGASGNVLTNLGSGAVPTYTTAAAGGAHDFAGALHNADTWADFLTKISDAIPLKVGDSVASLTLWAGHIGATGGHHAPTHNLGGGDHNPDTFANFITKISDAVPLKSGDSVASLDLWAGHIASANADRKSTRLNSSHIPLSRMPSSA